MSVTNQHVSVTILAYANNEPNMSVTNQHVSITILASVDNEPNICQLLTQYVCAANEHVSLSRSRPARRKLNKNSQD